MNKSDYMIKFNTIIFFRILEKYIKISLKLMTYNYVIIDWE